MTYTCRIWPCPRSYIKALNSQRFRRRANSPWAQVHQQHGSANQSQTHQMNARDEWEEPRRTAHRRQQRRILQKTLAMTFRRSIMCRAQNSADVCPGSNAHFAIPKVSHDLCQKRQSRIFRDFTTRFTRIFGRSQRFPKRINELRLVQALRSRAYQGGKQHVDRFWSFGDSNLVRYAYSSAWRSEIVRLVWRLRFEGNRRLL